MNMIDSRPTRKRRIAQAFGLSALLLSLSIVLAQTKSDLNKQDAKPASKQQTLPKTGKIPTFRKVELLKVEGKVVGDKDKITFGSPEFADWDGDGKTDLILGYWASWGLGPRGGAGAGGKVRFFKNISNKDLPEYRDMGDLKCDSGLVRLTEA